MKKKQVLLFGILLGIGVIVFAVLKFPNQTKTQPQVQQSKNSVLYQSQIDEKGEVVIEAKPLKISTRENTLFNLKFTTHSIELDYDIKALSTLSDDKANMYKPLSWTGGRGGHHIEGELIFPKISQDAKSVKLIISKINGQNRIFEWKLE